MVETNVFLGLKVAFRKKYRLKDMCNEIARVFVPYKMHF